MSRPEIGDIIEMPIMGNDVEIRVSGVPVNQPNEAEGVYEIVDQYGETHRIELDGDTWITVSPLL